MALETITAEELVNAPLRSPGWVVEDLIGVERQIEDTA